LKSPVLHGLNRLFVKSGTEALNDFDLYRVARDSAGNLYGSAVDPDLGEVFKLDTSGNETTLYAFTGGTDGEVRTVVLRERPFSALKRGLTRARSAVFDLLASRAGDEVDRAAQSSFWDHNSISPSWIRVGRLRAELTTSSV
jgi:hypothetical protein